MKARSRVALNFGIAIEARIPMITTTISSSISVKPCRCRFIEGSQVVYELEVRRAGCGERDPDRDPGHALPTTSVVTQFVQAISPPAEGAVGAEGAVALP